ncbi:MAG: DUF4347 domain-containing protein, partial [Rhodospirillales bacterium]|nr:DUF4347 domain-containing protein [Rhodospirillales bacterium]
MFDGAMAATDGDGPAQNGAAPNPAETSSDPAEGASKHETRSEKQTIVFVAGSIEGLDALEKALPASAEAIILSPDGDGVRQIAEHLDGRVGLRSIHVITHGSAGEVSLGNVTLSRDTLDDHRADLASWGNTLADGGDILFYGCNVGEGESGRDFVASLAEATGVDVAASDDDTGNGTAADWALEVASGSIDAENLFRDGAPDGFTGVLAAPTLTGLSNQTFDQNTVKAAHQTIGTGAVFNDPDGTLSSGAQLQVVNTAASQNYLESLWIDTDGTGISITGVTDTVNGYESQVTVDGTLVGTVGGGSSGGTLSFNFNTDATIAHVDKIIENITYRNINDDPAASRTIQFTFDDGTGATVVRTIDVAITAGNEAPRHRTSVAIESIDSVRDKESIDGPGWWVDRYPAAVFDNATLGGDTRIRLGIDENSTKSGY